MQPPQRRKKQEQTSLKQNPSVNMGYLHAKCAVEKAHQNGVISTSKALAKISDV